MKTENRLLWRLPLLFLACSLLLTGCTPANRTTASVDESQILLGFSQLGSESAWRIGNTKSVKDAAERAG
ncbi:MAG: hypothetical protein PHY64_06600, partial [Eubacteriales bacterium]|nr:hypothetical protein [Eubacteriales bacterium]